MSHKTASTEIIGIDLGGTWIRAGRVRNKQLVRIAQNPTVKTNNADEITGHIIKTVESIITPACKSIGIGVPGVLDRKKGIVYDVANIPSWKKVAIKDILQQKFGCPVFVDNDANCFALGERIFGWGADYENFVGITLGTGVGAGIIQNGRLLNDANCGSGEFCIVPYMDSDYEHYCSSLFFEKHGVNAKELFEQAKGGDKIASQIFCEFGFHIGQLIKMVVSAVDPFMIVFGGSISKAFPFFSLDMYEEMKNYAYPNSMENLDIRVSSLKEPAILGAAALCY
jgi:glucokinase